MQREDEGKFAALGQHMTGLVPTIYGTKNADARDRPGHDDRE
jgi:hypothetical protein